MNNKPHLSCLLCTVGLFLSSLMNTSAQNQEVSEKNIEAQVEKTLGKMTLEEKIAIIHAQSKFTSAGVPRIGIRQLNMDDGPHGVREELEWNSWSPARWTNDSVVAFPSLTCLAATWNRDLSQRYGHAVSEEFAYRGKDIMLGPGCNIARTPLNGRAFEYMGEDPYLAGEMLVPYIQAAQANGVACCLKHFVLNDQETDRFNVNVNVSERALHEIYLEPFRKAVEEAHVWTVMGSYNLWQGVHCCHNDSLINGILKGKWRFDGALISDWGGATNTIEAAHGGLDIEMGTYTDGKLKESEFGYDDYYLAKPFRRLVKDGSIPMQVLDDKVRRVLRTIFRTAMNPRKVVGTMCSEAHYEACREIGEEGIVLLKNGSVPAGGNSKGTAMLPLDFSRYNNVLVVGENATRSLTQGGGSSELKTLRDISPLEGLRRQAPQGCRIDYAQGYASGRAIYDKVDKVPEQLQQRLRDEALEKARGADLVVFVGGMNKNHKQDCENGDREGYDLSFGQNELISQLAQIQPNILVVTFGGNAYSMPWLKQVKALVHCWYLGSESGTALANVLTGRVNPCGRLPITIAERLEDYPYYAFGPRAYPGLPQQDDHVRRQVYYDEDLFVGYRHFDSKRVKALFPFGFGLSYTSFRYSNPQISSTTMTADGLVTLSIDVTNTGRMAGKEVVQLYLGQDKTSKDRPTKELKDFQKIHLQPNETKTVTFRIDKSHLRQYSENEHDWTVATGNYTAYISASVADCRHKIKFKVY